LITETKGIWLRIATRLFGLTVPHGCGWTHGDDRWKTTTYTDVQYCSTVSPHQTPSHMWSLRLLTPTNKFLPWVQYLCLRSHISGKLLPSWSVQLEPFFPPRIDSWTGTKTSCGVEKGFGFHPPTTHVSEPFSVAHLPRTFFIPCADAIHFISVGMMIFRNSINLPLVLVMNRCQWPWGM